MTEAERYDAWLSMWRQIGMCAVNRARALEGSFRIKRGDRRVGLWSGKLPLPEPLAASHTDPEAFKP